MAVLTVAEHIRRLKAGADREAISGPLRPKMIDIAAALDVKPRTLERYFKEQRATYGSLTAALDVALRALHVGGVRADTPVARPMTPGSPAAAAPVVREGIAPTDREIRDAAFWRQQAMDARKRAGEVEHLLEELAGLRQAAEQHVPDFLRETSPGGDASRWIAIAHTSDWHMGEVIDVDAIEGLNAFDPQECASRMHRYFDAVCSLVPRWGIEGTADGALLTFAGDLSSGDIHEELARTNALTSNEQVSQVAVVGCAGIEQLRDTFGRVHVVGVPGNHGRQTARPTAKLAARLSYDILAVAMMRDRFKGDSRVTWSIAGDPASPGATAGSFDVRVPIYGRQILVTHGDRIGTKGGRGFAGPILPIARGTSLIFQQYQSAGTAIDLILMGHYHFSCNPPRVLANGSVPGYSEYSAELRVVVQPPTQWTARYSARWGLAERREIVLDAHAAARLRALRTGLPA